MNNKSLNITFVVAQSPKEAFKAINQVSKWWTEHIEGSSDKLNDEFTVRFDDVHMSRQKLIEFVPGEKVTWLITDSKLSFLKDKSEWTNTRISFEISEKDKQTQVSFTHQGLLPTLECYKDCSGAWNLYIKNSLFKLITEGKGAPELKLSGIPSSE
jgi:hypothetical protein